MAWEKPMALILMRFHWFSQNWHNIGRGLHCMAHGLNSQWHTPRSCILCPKGLKHKKETLKVYMKYIQRQKIRESLGNYGKDFPDCHCHQATGWPFAKQTAVHFIVGACKQPLHRFLRCFSNWRKNFFSGGRLVDIGWRKISDWCFQWPQMQKWSFDQKAFPLNHINVIWNICSWRQPDNIYNSKQLI